MVKHMNIIETIFATICDFLEDKPTWMKVLVPILLLGASVCIGVLCIEALIQGTIEGIKCDFILLFGLDAFLNVSYSILEIITYNVCLIVVASSAIALYVYFRFFRSDRY